MKTVFMSAVAAVWWALALLPLPAQSWREVTDSGEYYYGEGRGSSVEEADRQALAALLSQISLEVSSSSEIGNRRREQAGSVASDETTFAATISTYSHATLTNTERLIIENEPDAHVGRWIRRTEVERIFAGRRAKVKEWVAAALRAETAGKADNALRYYYWAFTLLKSLQHPNEETYTDEDGAVRRLVTWIPEQMNSVFSDLKTVVATRDGDHVELAITYRGRPVSSVDYTYFDGRDWSNIYSAKDGRGSLWLASGNVSERLPLKYEYQYLAEAHIDREIENVLKVVSGTPMRAAYVQVDSRPHDVGGGALRAAAAPAGKAAAAKSQEVPSMGFSQLPAQQYRPPVPLEDDAAYRRVLKSVEEAVRARDYGAAAGCFTDSGLAIYDKLLKYGQSRIVGTPDYKFYRVGDEVVGRGLQLSFSFKSGMRRSFVEDVVFTFDAAGKIDNVTFGLGKTAETDILGKGVWPEATRVAIMQFLENYQTAYALGRLDYLRSIFDDDAIIITGRVVRRAATGRMDDRGNMALTNEIIHYNRQTKDVYLKRLESSFRSNEFINLRFADNDIRKLGKGGELYAIQISQEYYSSSYGDKGYLFLMVDINDPKNPIIKVRTWQPEKDPEFGIYGPEHF